jgi:hypothetical protein
MRRLAIFVMGITLLLPALQAAAETTPPPPPIQFGDRTIEPDPAGRMHLSECKKIAKQIIHFENDKAMADERENALWANATQAHLNRLENRWDDKCQNGVDEWQVAFNYLLKTAAKVAIRYFTMGGF